MPRNPVQSFEAAITASLTRLVGGEPTKLALAVSGGRDSVALLRVCAKHLGPDCCHVIHVDHQLRPSSAGDAEFVRAVSAEQGVSCEVITLPRDHSPGETVEERARRMRYAAIANAARRVGCLHVAVAHTLDDQAETILHRVVRGTGIAGLSGMPVRRLLAGGVEIVRPMLEVMRADVTEYLASLGQRWIDDETNASDAFTRNRLRNEVLPILQTLNPGVATALTRLGESAAQLAGLVETLAADRMRGLDKATVIPLDRFTETDPALIAECFRYLWRTHRWPEKGMTKDHWDALVDLVVTNRSSRFATLPGRITAKRTRESIEFQIGPRE